jgi:uncharacterized protein YjbJ (UPF0337 family)
VYISGLPVTSFHYFINHFINHFILEPSLISSLSTIYHLPSTIYHLPSTIYHLPFNHSIMSDNTGNASTGQSYIDQATGLAQRAMGTVTGDSSTQVSIHSSPPILYRITNPSQAKGDAKHEEGEAKKEASHTTSKLGPFTADPNTGAVARDDPKRDTGSWDQTVGSAKESVGNLIGNENLRRTGAEQNAAGKEQEAKGQLKDWGEGIQNRAQGTLGSIGAAVTGDRTEEEKYRDIHDEGKVRQRGAEADMAKKGGV